MDFQIFMILSLELSIGLLDKRKRIFGGENADLEEFPYMASLRTIMPHFHFCGGAIISNRYILTAAHCVYDKEVHKVRAYTGTNKIKPTSGHAHIILWIEVHPLFEKSPKSNHDIAVVSLKKSIQFNYLQNKIELPVTDIHDGDNAIVTGWGITVDSSTWSTEILQKASMKIININNCRKFVNIYLYDEQLCAHSLQYKARLSSGDSGGPLVVNGRIVGISSSNFPLIEDYPDVYTNVFAYLSFIKSRLEE